MAASEEVDSNVLIEHNEGSGDNKNVLSALCDEKGNMVLTSMDMDFNVKNTLNTINTYADEARRSKDNGLEDMIRGFDDGEE